MKYRLAAFDFDGTLADSFQWFLKVLEEIASQYRIRPVEQGDLEKMRGLNSRQLLKQLGIPTWKLPRLAAHVRGLQSRDLAQIRLFDGVLQMLEGLAGAGVAVAIVSSNSEENIRQVLGPAGTPLISHFGCGASLLGKRSKLKSLLKRFKVPPPQVIYIGDELRDIEAARSVGISSGAVAWGYATFEALKAHNPSELFERPADVVARLTQVAGVKS